MYNRFLRISSSEVDRFTSNQDQNDQRPTTHIVEYTSPAKMLRFDVIRHYAWPCALSTLNFTIVLYRIVFYRSRVDYLATGQD